MPLLRVRASGYSMMFGLGVAMDGIGFFSLFLDLFVPILAVIAVVLLSSFKVIKGPASKWIVLSVCGAGLYMALSNLVFMGQLSSEMGMRVGVGIILLFITWLLVATAAVLEFLNVHLVKFRGQA